MDIEIIVRGVEDASGLRGLAQRKLEAALQRYTTQVRRATMRLEDETGPSRHGVDKVCMISLRLRRGEVRVREVGPDFGPVIDVALDRMRAALGRKISRSKRGVGEG